MFQRGNTRDTGAVRREFFLLLLFARTVLPLHADDDAPVWSPVQSGLQARLFISQAQTADYTYGVSIEFRNVLENSSAVGIEQKLGLNREQIVFTVRDAGGHHVPRAPVQDLDETVPGWSLTLPAWARLSFPIGGGGGTPLHFQGPGKLLGFGGMQQWVLPPNAGPYQLSATLYSNFQQAMQAQAEAGGMKILNIDRSMPRDFPGGPHGGWQGTLDLPPINLPQN
ncbi:MAG TPA: hypothetical protein VHY09_03985 [Candidatus Methylacidiphilales bacterium]|nr:hypothetical protein [Candidatus Methylacidiphilales bacterium]